MNPSKAYYSIIQYCPDLGRSEAANVGVIVFCPERGFLRAMTSRSNSRIIRFFGSEGHDWKRINSFKRGLEHRLQVESAGIQNIGDLQQFIALRANVLQITQPKPMKLSDPAKALHDLYEQIIGEPASKARKQSLKRFVGDRLSRADIAAKVVRDIRVTVPVIAKDVDIPFGFQNGRFNLINPVRFTAENADQAVYTACKYAVEGKALYDFPDPQRGPRQLFIVGQFRPKDQEAPRRVRQVFDEYHVRLFKTDEISKLVDEIRRTGKDISPSST